MENVTSAVENVTETPKENVYYQYYPYYYYYDPLADYFSERVVSGLVKGGFPVIGICTLIGNVFVILVMLRPNYWNAGSTSLMIILMSGTDVWAVLLSYSRSWSSQNFGSDLRRLNMITCKLHSWQTYASVFFKPGLFIGVMFERTASLCWTNFHKTLTRKVMLIYSGCYLTSAYALTVSLPIYQTIHDSGACTHHSEYFPTMVFPAIDMVFSTLMPTTVLVIMCLIMTIRVSLNHRDLPRPLTQQQTDRRSLSIMMLIRTLIFFSANLPIVILLNDELTGYVERSLADDWAWIAMYRLMFALAIQWFYIGALLNFPVYMCFSRFRNEFIEMIRTCHQWCYCSRKIREKRSNYETEMVTFKNDIENAEVEPKG